MESKVAPAGALRPTPTESHTFHTPVVREVPLLHGGTATGGR
jgi:hypothetical protein